MAYHCEDGFASLKTPAFSLEVQVDQCAKDPKNYRLTTAITDLHQSEIVDNPSFHSCFTHHCDQLTILPDQLIDVEAKIDALEALPELRDQITYEPDGSACLLQLRDLDLQISITESEIVFSLLNQKNLQKLLHGSQKVFGILTAAGLNPHLP